MPKLTPGSLRSYGDDRRIDRGSQKKFRSLFIDTVLSMVCSMGFSQLAVESLDPRLDDSVLSFLNSSSARIFCRGRNFRELVLDRENFTIVQY